MKHRIKFLIQNPIYVAIGLCMIFYGCFFIVHDHYFVFPPFLKKVENSDAVGFSFLLSGLAMILSKIFPDKITPSIEALVMAVSSALMTALSVIEILHNFFLGLAYPWVPNLCIAIIITVLAYRSGK